MAQPIHPTPRCVYAQPSSPALKALDSLPSNPRRASAVHNLVRALGLLQDHRLANDSGRARVLSTKLASRAELESFHDPEYVAFLLKGLDPETPSDDSEDIDGSDRSSRSSANSTHDQQDMPPSKRQKLVSEQFGLEHDCPPFPQLAHYALAVAGAALEISRELRDDRADVGIVWDGGRHHAQRSSAAGFCYVNDVALAISELRREPTDPSLQRLDRVLYIDLDLHHGDGVELAFWSTSRVLTVSVHFHDPEGGFYPLTGAVDSCGPAPPSPAASHALNIPLADPLAGSLAYVCTRTLLPLIGAYKPAATLVQCGVDGLAGDPVGGSHWGFGLEEMGSCVGALVKASLAGGAKVLLLGGGGYHTANAARAWAYFTSIALGKPLALSTEIPLGLERAVDYGPSYTLDVPASEKYCGQTKVAGDGTDGKIKSVIEKVERHVEFVREKYRSL